MTTPVNLGRGAWTPTGKGNGSRLYEYIAGKPLDGATPTTNLSFLAVNLGVKAIQTEINAMGYAPALTTDGVLGPKSQAGIKWAQTQHGLSPDGRAGSVTCRAMWKRQLRISASKHGIDPKYVWGQMIQESSGDPGAVGYYTPSDRGLVQINVVVHSAITPQQAHNTEFAFDWSCLRFKNGMGKYASKPALQITCAIAMHNSP